MDSFKLLKLLKYEFIELFQNLLNFSTEMLTKEPPEALFDESRHSRYRSDNDASDKQVRHYTNTSGI